MEEDSVDLYDDLWEDAVPSVNPDEKVDENSTEIFQKSQNKISAADSLQTKLASGIKPPNTHPVQSSPSGASSGQPAPVKLSFQSILKAIVDRENESAHAESEGGVVSEQKRDETKEDDLMNDVYSLHTERDIAHRKELRLKQDEIDKLNITNDQLTAQNKQLRHNIALLLATAKRELEGQKALIIALRKQLVTAESITHSNRRFPQNLQPYNQSSSPCNQSSLPYNQGSLPFNHSSHSSLPYNQGSMDATQSLMPCTQSPMNYNQIPMNYTPSPMNYTQGAQNVEPTDTGKPFKRPKSKSKSPRKYHKENFNSRNSSHQRRGTTPSRGRGAFSAGKASNSQPSWAHESSGMRGKITSRSRIDKAKENLRQRQQPFVESIDRDYLSKFDLERYERHVQRTTSHGQSVCEESTSSNKLNHGDSDKIPDTQPHGPHHKRVKDSSVAGSDPKRRKVHKHSPRKSLKKHKTKSHSKHRQDKDVPLAKDGAMADLLRLKESLLSALDDNSNVSSVADSESAATRVDICAKSIDTLEDSQLSPPDYASKLVIDEEAGTESKDECEEGAAEGEGEVNVPETTRSLDTNIEIAHTASNGNTSCGKEVILTPKISGEEAAPVDHKENNPSLLKSSLSSSAIAARAQALASDCTHTTSHIAKDPRISTSERVAAPPYQELGAGDQIVKATCVSSKPSAHTEPQVAFPPTTVSRGDTVTKDFQHKVPACHSGQPSITDEVSDTSTACKDKPSTQVCGESQSQGDETKSDKKSLSKKTSMSRKRSRPIEIPLEGVSSVDPRLSCVNSACGIVDLLSVDWFPVSASRDVTGVSGSTRDSDVTGVSGSTRDRDGKILSKKVLTASFSVESTTDSEKPLIAPELFSDEQCLCTASSSLETLAPVSDLISCAAKSNVKDQISPINSDNSDAVKITTAKDKSVSDNDVTSSTSQTTTSSVTSMLDVCQGSVNKQFRIPKKTTTEVTAAEGKPISHDANIINPYAVAPVQYKQSTPSCLGGQTESSTPHSAVKGVGGQGDGFMVDMSACDERPADTKLPFPQGQPTAEKEVPQVHSGRDTSHWSQVEDVEPFNRDSGSINEVVGECRGPTGSSHYGSKESKEVGVPPDKKSSSCRKSADAYNSDVDRRKSAAKDSISSVSTERKLFQTNPTERNDVDRRSAGGKSVEKKRKDGFPKSRYDNEREFANSRYKDSLVSERHSAEESFVLRSSGSSRSEHKSSNINCTHSSTVERGSAERKFENKQFADKASAGTLPGFSRNCQKSDGLDAADQHFTDCRRLPNTPRNPRAEGRRRRRRKSRINKSQIEDYRSRSDIDNNPALFSPRTDQTHTKQFSGKFHQHHFDQHNDKSQTRKGNYTSSQNPRKRAKGETYQTGSAFSVTGIAASRKSLEQEYKSHSSELPHSRHSSTNTSTYGYEGSRPRPLKPMSAQCEPVSNKISGEKSVLKRTSTAQVGVSESGTVTEGCGNLPGNVSEIGQSTSDRPEGGQSVAPAAADVDLEEGELPSSDEEELKPSSNNAPVSSRSQSKFNKRQRSQYFKRKSRMRHGRCDPRGKGSRRKD